jgi:hypothetical protein
VEAGRLWKARDRLHGVLRDRQDSEVLDLLATVHYEMHDLPAAGALWFVTGRADEIATSSVSAWRERNGNDEARWHSLPGPVRRGVQSQHLGRLEGAARSVAAGRRRRWVEPGGSVHSTAWWMGFEPVIFAVVVTWILAMIGIGTWTVIRWIWG